MGFAECIERFTKAEIKLDEPLKNHTGYGVGGKADYFVKVSSVIDLRESINFAKEFNIEYKILANGTNLLFSDSGFKGVVIYTGGLDRIYIDNIVKCMCGASLVKLIERLNALGITSLYPLCGIPATVGGAVMMNAGAFGTSISDFILGVEILSNNKLEWIDVENCGFRYRGSKLLDKKQVLTSVYFDILKLKNKSNYLTKEEYCNKRKSSQPKGRSCGSVFKNPTGDYAGRLIERCGLKGFNIGGAKISELHGNFIVTKENACAKDIYDLVQLVKQTVNERFGVKLCEEIEMIGDFK